MTIDNFVRWISWLIKKIAEKNVVIKIKFSGESPNSIIWIRPTVSFAYIFEDVLQALGKACDLQHSVYTIFIDLC